VSLFCASKDYSKTISIYIGFVVNTKMSRILSTVLAIASIVSAIATATIVPFERLNLNDSVLLILDLQEGLYQLARDFDPTLYHNNLIAHAALGKLFDIPVILTTSAETGPNGPLPKEILEMYPTSPLIKRQGEVDAWDNSDFRAAIRATGRSQVIVGGITTDVCMRNVFIVVLDLPDHSHAEYSYPFIKNTEPHSMSI
jgi:hypothetical protein